MIPLPNIIDESHIYLLEQLMRISPNIKSCVRNEALKLADKLKAMMKEKTEVLSFSFLLILSIYGLLTYFDKDEVSKLFAYVAEYKIVVELFKTLVCLYALLMVCYVIQLSNPYCNFVSNHVFYIVLALYSCWKSMHIVNCRS